MIVTEQDLIEDMRAELAFRRFADALRESASSCATAADALRRVADAWRAHRAIVRPPDTGLG